MHGITRPLVFLKPTLEDSGDQEQTIEGRSVLTVTKITKNGPFLRMVHSWSFI